MYRITIISLLIWGFCSSSLDAQSFWKNLFRKKPSPSEQMMMNGNYEAALVGLDSMILKKPSKNRLKLQKAICQYHLNRLDEAEKALVDLTKVPYKKAPVFYYLARIQHSRLQFEDAAALYKLYLSRADRSDKYYLKAKKHIQNCGYGKKLIHKPEIAFVDNIGTKINTKYNDFDAIQSHNYQDRFYFSSNRPGSNGGLRNKEGLLDSLYGHYRTDIYSTDVINGVWTDVYAFDPLLNSAKNDGIYGFQNGGTSVLFYQSLDNISYDIFTNEYSSEELRDLPSSLNSKIKGGLGDKNLAIFNDNIFIFSSKREGGNGGYDLYVTKSFDDNYWVEPINFGSAINSSFDDICPFVTSDGLSLYFSSNRENSLGGFDIYRSDYSVKEKTWSTPENLGSPVNSAGNDLHFRLTKDGKSATLSSDRKEGLGGFDMYIAYLKKQDVHQIVDNTQFAFFEQSQEDEFLAIDSSYQIELDIIQNDQETDISTEEEEIKEYSIESLQYNENQSIMQPKNVVILDRLVDLLKVYPKVVLSMNSYVLPTDDGTNDLYFSIKQAETALEYLINKGVNKNQVLLKGYGSKYPVLKASTAFSNLRTLNNRIELVFHHTDEYPLAIETPPLKIPEDLLNDKYTDLEQSWQGITYGLILKKTQQRFFDDNLQTASPAYIIRSSDSKENLYGIYNFKDFNQALRYKNQLKSQGKSDVELMAFLNGLPVAETGLRALLETYPSLAPYLEYLDQN